MFRALVLARLGGRCALCENKAVDAHHILERRLFPDGGYRLSNGAPVCEHCHWDCETTRVSVERVREACSITAPCLPPGFATDAVYDKWGNRVALDGTRQWGPLAHDAGARKALARGGVLDRFTDPSPP